MKINVNTRKSSSGLKVFTSIYLDSYRRAYVILDCGTCVNDYQIVVARALPAVGAGGREDGWALSRQGPRSWSDFAEKAGGGAGEEEDTLCIYEPVFPERSHL